MNLYKITIPMKKSIPFSCLIALTLAGCNSSENKNAETDDHQHLNAPVAGEGAAGSGSDGITLNNGERWAANAETTAGIKNMQSLVDAMSENPTPEDYHALKASLETSFDGILQQCTMTGEAHNQLHNYLMPMKAMFDGLGAEDAESCKKSLESLHGHLGKYDSYFM
jgi:hypothetical protein